MTKITDKTVKSKYPPKQTNVTWIDTSEKPTVTKSFIDGKWVVVGGGVTDYNDIKNKPTINGVELDGNKTSQELGVYSKPSTGIPQSDLSSDVQSQLNKHFKGWYDTLEELKASHTATDGDSAYVKDASPATTWSIYVYDSTASSDNYWADSGTDADTSNVQTFASSQEVNEVHIVNDLATGGVDDVLSAEQGKVIGNKLSDVSIDGVSDENDEIIIKDEQGNQVAKVNDEGIDAIGLKINGVTVNAGTMLSGKKIALFGDSIMQLRDNSGNGVPEYIATITGATVYRCSVGGLMLARRLSTLTPVESATYANQLINYLDFGHSFRKVATPVATRDLTDVNAAWSKLKTDYQQLDSADITTAMDNWNNIDFENIDIVIMSAGTNDTRYITLGNDDSEDEITINGSVNAAVKTLLTNFPHISFYIFTPTVHYIEGTWSDDYTANDPGMNQLKPEELYMGIAAAAKRNHIPVKDMYNGMGWTRYNFSHYCHQNDGIHPYEGFKNMAMAMSSFIIANETFK